MNLRDGYLEEDLFPKLFTNYEERSYGILFYNEENRDSYDSNHAVIYKDRIDYSYGAVSGWLIDGVCGIIYRDGTLRFEPHPDRSLGFAKAAWNSPGGRIESAWRYEGGQVRYDFTVPAGLTAEVTLPDGRKCTLKEGTHTI